jgi:hypothetical protein
VIQDELFGDTDAPALVACFGREASSDADVYTGTKQIGKLSKILSLRAKKESARQRIVFNDPAGRIGLRAVDGSDGNTPIQFVSAADFDYPTSSVLGSSRLMTYLDLPELLTDDVPKVIEAANVHLNRIRMSSGDLVLAPFKGNDRNGKRRRRLDYALARRILNQAALEI